MLLFNRVVSSMLQISMNFNTSNVTIQRISNGLCDGFYANFNTSNVTIQLIGIMVDTRLIIFQYI